MSPAVVQASRRHGVELASVCGPRVVREAADGTYLALWSALEPVGMILPSGLLVWMLREPKEAGTHRPSRETSGDSAGLEGYWGAGEVWLGHEFGWRALLVTCFENLDGLETALRRGVPWGSSRVWSQVRERGTP